MCREVGVTGGNLRFLESRHEQKESVLGNCQPALKLWWKAQFWIKLLLWRTPMREFTVTESSHSCSACMRHSRSLYHHPAALYAVRLSETFFFMNLSFLQVLLEHFLLPGPSSRCCTTHHRENHISSNFRSTIITICGRLSFYRTLNVLKLILILRWAVHSV